jgi:hypothetical protein
MPNSITNAQPVLETEEVFSEIKKAARFPNYILEIPFGLNENENIYKGNRAKVLISENEDDFYLVFQFKKGKSNGEKK